MIKSELYKDCTDITLSVFLDVMYSKDYKKLIKKINFINPSMSELADRWASIYDEYTELSANESTQVFFTLLKQKTVLQNKIYIIQTCIDSLKENYNLDLVNVLKRLGYNFKFSKKTLIEDLKKVVAKCKPLVLQIKKLDESLAPYMAGEDLKPSEFEEVLVTLSKFQGYRLDKNQITVSEFVNILNNFKICQTPKK